MRACNLLFIARLYNFCANKNIDTCERAGNSKFTRVNPFRRERESSHDWPINKFLNLAAAFPNNYIKCSLSLSLEQMFVQKSAIHYMIFSHICSAFFLHIVLLGWAFKHLQIKSMNLWLSHDSMICYYRANNFHCLPALVWFVGVGRVCGENVVMWW